MSRCSTPLPLQELLDWERGDLLAAEDTRVEEHLLGCGECAERLAEALRLGGEVARLVAQGRVSAAVTGDLVEAADRRGLRVRTYRLAPGEAVACTAAPEDGFVVVRLAVDARLGEAVDLLSEVRDLTTGATSSRRIEDVPVDRSRGELVMLYSGDLVRSLPRTLWTLHAATRGPEGERLQGPYTLDHTPWSEGPPR
jgi:hypothetical protein